MFCALLTSRYQVSVYRTNGPLVCVFNRHILSMHDMKYEPVSYNDKQFWYLSAYFWNIPFLSHRIFLEPHMESKSNIRVSKEIYKTNILNETSKPK